MQTIRLDIDENKLQTVLTLLENLKDGIVKNIRIESNNEDDDALQEYKKTKEFQDDRDYFQECLEDIENNRSTLLTEKEYALEMENFTTSLKQKHENY
ncbi:MAG: hypothetical protein RBR59_05740 [Sulfurimonadaceae bacterium]|jgi:hypothetical protein|nr:hypothetical protein [Sulfurimonadaceae bacterium]